MILQCLGGYNAAFAFVVLAVFQVDFVWMIVVVVKTVGGMVGQQTCEPSGYALPVLALSQVHVTWMIFYLQPYESKSTSIIHCKNPTRKLEEWRIVTIKIIR